MKHKRIICILLIAIALMTMLFMLVACNDDGQSNGGQKVEIGYLDYGFVQSEDGNSINPDDTQYLVGFTVGEIYYMVIDFSFVAVESSEETQRVSFKIVFDNIDAVQGTLEDARTGDVVSMSFQGSNGGRSVESVVTFAVPRDKGATSEKRIIIKLVPKKSGDTTIRGMFEGENIDLIGDIDGFTKSISATGVQLETPSLNVDANGILSWNHVKNADYYKLVVDGVIVEAVIDAENKAVGAIINCALSEYGYVKGQTIQVVAYSDNVEYAPSNLSNPVVSPLQ